MNLNKRTLLIIAVASLSIMTAFAKLKMGPCSPELELLLSKK